MFNLMNLNYQVKLINSQRTFELKMSKLYADKVSFLTYLIKQIDENQSDFILNVAYRGNNKMNHSVCN